MEWLRRVEVSFFYVGSKRVIAVQPSFYRVETAMAEHVPSFGPPLPEKAIFYDEAALRSFLLAKCKYSCGERWKYAVK